MNAELNRDFTSPALALQALVAEHGLATVVMALAALMTRRPGRPARVRDEDLPDWIRQDIGLDPLPPARKGWDL